LNVFFSPKLQRKPFLVILFWYLDQYYKTAKLVLSMMGLLWLHHWTPSPTPCGWKRLQTFQTEFQRHREGKKISPNTYVLFQIFCVVGIFMVLRLQRLKYPYNFD
jgi:hypothetical protein